MLTNLLILRFFRDQHFRRNCFDPITLNSFSSLSSSMPSYARELPPGWLVGEAVLGQGPAMAPHCCRSMHQLSTALLPTLNPCFCVPSRPEIAALSSLLAWSTETKKCTTASLCFMTQLKRHKSNSNLLRTTGAAY